jgi:hypothetical protein
MTRPKSVLLAAALLAACGPEPSGGAAGRSAPDSAAAPVEAAAERGTVDTLSRVPAASRGALVVVLAPEGLEIAAGGGVPKRLAFGGPGAGVLADVGAVLGEPAEQGTQEECPAGPLQYATYGQGLQLQFQDGAFVGWSARRGSTFRTTSGIGPGSTLGQVRAAYPAATVQQTSLGTEFAAGDLYGVVADPSPAGNVEIMFAGTNCIFR